MRKHKKPPVLQDFIVEVLGEAGEVYYVKLEAYTPKEAVTSVAETSKLEVVNIHRVH
jgi:hypothetical protein